MSTHNPKIRYQVSSEKMLDFSHIPENYEDHEVLGAPGIKSKEIDFNSMHLRNLVFVNNKQHSSGSLSDVSVVSPGIDNDTCKIQVETNSKAEAANPG